MRLRFLVVFLLLSGTAFSQSFTGMVDGYWSYNANTPMDSFGDRINSHRAFDVRDQQFALNYAELAIDYKPNKWGFRADLGIGDTADVVHAAEPGGQNLWRHVQQAFVTMTHNDWTVDFGKFVTPIGAEVIETKDNWNYSRGFLFTKAIPFYHFGARVGAKVNDNVSVTGYLVNGWDNVKDTNTAKSVGFSGIFKYQKMTFVTNYMWGKEVATTNDARQILDGIFIWELHPDLTLMGNYDYGEDKGPQILPGLSGPLVVWQGVAGYLKYNVKGKVILVPRYEWFEDRHGYRTGVAQEMESATLTAQFPVEDATIWTEFRRDWSTSPSAFATSSPGIFGPILGTSDHQSTFVVGLTYSFTKGMR
jgi:hypothetical protein